MYSRKDVMALADNSLSGASSLPQAFGETAQWVVFRLDTAHYALPLAAVDRVVRAAHVTPLPLAPSIVLGAIDVEGYILPVFNLRRRFRLPERPIEPTDQFLIARTAHRTVVLLIDAALGVVEQPATAMVEAARLTADLAHIRGVIRVQGGLVLIQDLEQFLSPDEASALQQAMGGKETSHAG
jgi:purine-binding chemotaxis protein CheW